MFAKEGKAKDEGKWRRIGETSRGRGEIKDGRTSVAEGENSEHYAREVVTTSSSTLCNDNLVHFYGCILRSWAGIRYGVARAFPPTNPDVQI